MQHQDCAMFIQTLLHSATIAHQLHLQSRSYSEHKALQKYYEARFDLFSQQGWLDLMEDVDVMLDAMNNVSTIADEKSLQFRKGEISILTWLKTLKGVSERAYEDLNEKNV